MTCNKPMFTWFQFFCLCSPLLLWCRHLVITFRAKLKISKFVHFAEIKKKFTSSLWTWIFQIFGIFLICFGCFLLTNATEKNSLNYRSFTKPYPCNIDSFKTTGLWPRPVTLWEQDETWNLQDRDWDSQKRSRDEVLISRLHHCKWSNKVVKSKKFLNLLTCKNCYLFMVRQFFMVALMLNMHCTSNSTPMKFFTTSTSCCIQGKWAVNYLFCVHRQ